MKQVALNVKTRDAVGSTAVKRLRAEGQIPAVMYGESGVRHLQISAEAFFNAWRQIGGRAALLELHPDGAEDSTFAIIKDYQRNPRTDRFEHVDLLEIVRGKEMEAAIPVHTVGTAFGVKNQQGVLEVHAHELVVRCRPRNLPEFINVDVKELRIGNTVRVSDLPELEGVTFIDDREHVIVACVGHSAGSSGEVAEEGEDEVTPSAERERDREREDQREAAAAE